MREVNWGATSLAMVVVGLIAYPACATPQARGQLQIGMGNSGSTVQKQGGTGPTTGKTGGKNNSNANNGYSTEKKETETVLGLLKDAKHELSGVHFPYEGHRAKAIKEIDRAVRELRPPNPDQVQQTAPKNPPAQRPNTTPRPTQPQGQKQPPSPKPQQTQAEADAKLREALTALEPSSREDSEQRRGRRCRGGNRRGESGAEDRIIAQARQPTGSG